MGAPQRRGEGIAISPFEKAVTFVLAYEGGYSHDERDPGGETNFGISKRSYPSLNIKTLTRDDAIAIYQRDYWNACKCGQLPSPIALMVFDCAVNQGVATAAYLLQEAVGVQQDGIVGTMTIAAARRINLKTAISSYFAGRCQRYATAKNVHIYGKGWFKRAAACLVTALEPL